jgi:hypothetical protein
VKIKMRICKIICAAILAVMATSNTLLAQEAVPIKQYLDSVNYGFVSFEGELAYDRRENEFWIKIDDGYFRAVIDAGRELRESVQEQCERISFSYEGGCRVIGAGTIEIRGANLWVSVESLDTIEKFD